MMDRSALRQPLLFLILVIVADQVSKVLLIDLMAERQFVPLSLLPFFDLVMVWNPGVSFGLFSGDWQKTRWMLAGLNAVVSLGLLVWMMRADSRLVRLALASVIGGALGNAIDRLIYGRVADFFDFHVGAWHWPAFNIADVAITCGVAVLVLDSLFGGQDRAKDADHERGPENG